MCESKVSSRGKDRSVVSVIGCAISCSSGHRFSRWIGVALISAAILIIGLGEGVCQSDAEWNSRIRGLVDAGRTDQAAGAIAEWLRTDPRNLEARAWHARLQAWSRQWREAEAEYRELIPLAPLDVDLLSGLADVLIWQNRRLEALAYLDQAKEIDPKREDCRIRRAHVLKDLGRLREAEIAYQEILNENSGSEEARKGLNEIRGSGRHELRLNYEHDNLSYAENAAAFNLAMRSRWTPHLATFVSVQQNRRFGEEAAALTAGFTLHFSPRQALTAAGSVAQENGIIPRTQAEFEYSRGVHLSDDGPVRGMEALYRQRWLWYRDTRLLVLSPGVVLYLPKDWHWMFQFSTSRMATGGSMPEWKPSGSTRLSFPLGSRAGGYVLFAAGIENFGYADQIGRYSMRTWGAGLRFKIAGGQEILGHSHYQLYSRGQSLINVGVSYVVRF